MYYNKGSKYKQKEVIAKDDGIAIDTPKLEAYWNDNEAAIYYVLSVKKHEARVIDWGFGIHHIDRGWRTVSTGNIQWGERIAKHYNLELPEYESRN